MSDVLPFIVTGIISGVVYGLAGSGLVLTFKTSGIFNFGQGAILTAAVLVFYWLNVTLELDWKIAFFLSVFVAGPLFVVAFLIEGAIRDAYDALRQPVSALEIGPWGWVQQVNFIITGILMIACAIGLRTALQRSGGSTSAPVLITLAGIGLVGAGIFVMGEALHIPSSMLFLSGMVCSLGGGRCGAVLVDQAATNRGLRPE